MITDEDLPAPWRVVASPIDQKQAAALDALAGLPTEADDLALVSWDLLENAETSRRVMLRMGTGESGVEITGVYVPGPGSVGIGELRSIPLAAIEAAVRSRTAQATARVSAALMAGPDDGPLGNPTGPNDTRFYGRLALRYLRVAATSHRPATDLAKEEGVTPRTAQRWISRARELGLLPPGRPGRAS
ncbi:helix-turn-helix domain-containing protein [Streptomyces sp. NPDC002587]